MHTPPSQSSGRGRLAVEDDCSQLAYSGLSTAHLAVCSQFTTSFVPGLLALLAHLRPRPADLTRCAKTAFERVSVVIARVSAFPVVLVWNWRLVERMLSSRCFVVVQLLVTKQEAEEGAMQEVWWPREGMYADRGVGGDDATRIGDECAR